PGASSTVRQVEPRYAGTLPPINFPAPVPSFVETRRPVAAGTVSSRYEDLPRFGEATNDRFVEEFRDQQRAGPQRNTFIHPRELDEVPRAAVNKDGRSITFSIDEFQRQMPETWAEEFARNPN